MRATQFVRRGLIAFATVATLSAGFAGVAGAEAVIDGDDAIVWNPVWPTAFHGQGWAAAQFVAALVFVAAGIRIKVRNPEDRNRR